VKKNFWRLVQVSLTIFFIYITLNQIDIETLLTLLENVNVSYILISILLYSISQVVSSERLRLILNSNDYKIYFKNNFILYLIGIFYNFFIPGGFGGDAYKFYLMKKNYSWNFKKLFKLLVFDRLIGLGALVCILLFIIQNFIFDLNLIVSAISLAAALIIGYYIVKYFFNNHHIYFKSLSFSAINQLLQFLTIFFIILSLGIENNYVEIIVVFICSSILSVFSIGGIGIREYIFMMSASFINVSPELSASVGLLFTFSASFSTIPGLGYLINKPQFLK
tara:strand:+ start:152 stop:988 length:837 start_codon:yes stop_codon:yes gene_type:complete